MVQRAGAQLAFDKGFAKGLAHAHDFTGGLHLGAQGWCQRQGT
jgi:hypothetical protein